MRRYFKFLTTSLIACVLTIACVNELDLHQPINESEFYTTLVPRVEGFANQYITKSSYNDEEQTITKLAILVFNEDGKCIHLQESKNENGGPITPITLNKSMLNSPAQSGKLDQATVVMIANIGTDKIVNGEKTIKKNWSDLTFSDLENYSFQYDDAQTIITSFGEGFSGFPMIGGASKVNLTSTKNQDPIVVNLKILYAKIKFAISVENGTENEGSGMSFTLNNYSVFNASKQTKLAVPINQGEPTMTFEEFLLGQKASESPQPATESSATESASYAFNNPDPDNQDNQGSAAGPVSVSVVDEKPISFTFYVSESRFNHNLDLKGLAEIYPYGWTTSDPEEDVKEGSDDKPNGVKYFYDDLVQQYKPLLAQSTSGMPGQGLATYVLLNGSYKDYRGQIWNVNYKVYLGKDNSQNFQVDRNSCYTNNIVIKGIRNNNDTDGRGEVWIDHRVDVEIGGDDNSAADHITITRETLIDSHIEVRPLRVRWDNDEYDLVKLYLPIKDNDKDQLVDWIGIERFVDGVNNQDPSIYCYSNVTSSNPVSKSTGKRRYFTDGLISELQNKEGEFGVQSEGDGTKFIYLHNTQCAWIYFDENNTTSDRTADIKLHFYKSDGKYIEEIYEVKQEGLLSLGGYYVESYEEYLYSYDSEDKYNLSTSPVDYTQQGLKWGYEDTQLSTDIIVSMNDVNLSQAVISQRYDFLVKGDSYDSWHMYHRGGGLLWDEITNYDNQSGMFFTDMVTEKDKVSIMDMGTMPESAYQYCLSKNKFAVGADEKVSMKVHWYLPDVSEMQDILSSGSNSLYSDVYYWSSQPSFSEEKEILSTYLNENTGSARAVSNLVEKPVDLPRKHQHRIRCLYSPVGIEADMDERTPDGIGGNYIFVMKGSPADGYFKYMLPQSKDTTIISDNYENEVLKYPTKGNSSQSDAEFSYIVMTDYNNQQKEGFVVNPLLKVNWNEYTDNILGIINDYYTTIAPNAFPGLSEYETEKHSLYNAYKQTDVKRADVEIRTKNTERKKSQNLSSTLDKPLDYQKNGDKLRITLSKNRGEYSPVFDYNELISDTTIHSTKYWNLPKYSSLEVLLTPDGKTISAQGQGEDEQLIVTNKDIAKERAFNEAYADAKEESLKNLKNSIKSKYSDLKYDEALIRYEPEGLTINSQNDCITFTEEEAGTFIKRKYIKCEITLTASLRGRDSLFVLTSGGEWGDPEEDITTNTNLPQVKTDELRIYSGNSFTISLSDKYKDTYEITKVKVHYSGSYQISGGSIWDGGDATYMRFVLDDPKISLPISETVEKESFLQQPSETLDLPGMGYSDGENGGWQEWSGEGRSSVSLTLADYFVNNDVLENSYTYKYDNASTNFGKSIVIDKIEVKCTKKPEAGN